MPARALTSLGLCKEARPLAFRGPVVAAAQLAPPAAERLLENGPLEAGAR